MVLLVFRTRIHCCTRETPERTCARVINVTFKRRTIFVRFAFYSMRRVTHSVKIPRRDASKALARNAISDLYTVVKISITIKVSHF